MNTNTNTNTGTNTNTSTNELITAINSARTGGTTVRAIRKQKHDPNNFYMTLADGKQVGPLNVQGNPDELNRKFGEAQSYLHGTKNTAKSGNTGNNKPVKTA